MQSLFLELEGEVDVDQPVDEDLAHVRSDVGHEFFLLFLLYEGGRYLEGQDEVEYF